MWVRFLPVGLTIIDCRMEKAAFKGGPFVNPALWGHARQRSHQSLRPESIKAMENSQLTFQYTEEVIATFEKYLSAERLAPYYILARGDKWVGIQLYERNCQLSEALYGVIQGLEVALRNAIHNLMTNMVGAADWYDKFAFEDSERDAIDEAKAKIVKKNSTVTPGRVVAELTFGFWVKLFAWPYEKTLWVPCLYRIFPLKMKRTTLHGRLVDIKTLRNHIAHHERIVRAGRDLPKDCREILEAIGWVSPTIREWVRHTNSFQERWDKKLKKTRPTPPKAAPDSTRSTTPTDLAAPKPAMT